MASTPTEVVRTTRDGDVLVVVIDNPPVNASTAAVRAGLAAALASGASDPSLQGVVLIGEGANFVAGSDINEFSGPIAEPSMPAVIALVETCPVPVVAAIRGAALGGGLELALACDARLAAPDAAIGLPEVGLGILPGAGGTARLPRIVGAARALVLIGETTRLTAEEACQLGIVDELVDGDLLAAAKALARSMGSKRLLRLLPVPPSDPAELEAAEARAVRAAGDRPHVHAAIAAVRRAEHVPFDEAITLERAAFNELRVGDEAAALRYLFFAERRAEQRVRRARAEAVAVERVVVVGAGAMGASIAWAFAANGLSVVLTDAELDAAERGRDRIASTAGRRLDPAERDLVLARLTTGAGVAAAADAQLVVEAVFEDLSVKQEVFRTLDAVVAPGTILASNTSYLDIDALAAVTTRPHAVLGMHFFAPAHVMRLLEIVQGAQTAETALATALEIGARLGKVPVVARVGDGFIGNRIFGAYRRQNDLMLEEGAYPEEIDDAMRAFGFGMGPFAVSDMSGLDISWRNRLRLAPMRDPRERYVEIADQLCEAGRLGQKTGAGWYRYEDGRTPLPDPEVRALVEAASAAKGITRRSFTADEIVERALVTMVNEAGLVLDEGVAASPEDVDLVLVHGFGFPRHRGGPLHWAAGRDPARLGAALDRTAEATGYGFRRTDLSALLSSLG
ncbi:MAG: 3-hydroxyacyl-CoA dehydrogenase NAD-binding domain-containing protein [Acidimicrobiia bacterium]